MEKVGLTTNNVTYAVLGEAFRYWEFFPTEPGRGVVPLWGLAEIIWHEMLSGRADPRSGHVITL